MTLHWERSEVDGNWYLADVDRPHLDKRMLDSAIVECRVFFAPSEDCYLPGVVSSLQALVTPEQARDRRALKAHVAQVVRGSNIGASGPVFHSGRLEMDNGLGPGILLGSDLIAMDYIYGVALHEDDERLARLENVSSMDTMIEAVIHHFNDLLHVVANVRAQIESDLGKGYFTIAPSVQLDVTR
ncbi:hypothetical protein BH11ACT4_BH11ACT4_05120 [soil metagenome]